MVATPGSTGSPIARGIQLVRVVFRKQKQSIRVYKTMNSDRRHRLAIGDDAPNFSLPDDQANKVTLNDVLRERGGLLAFVHGTWCPVCVQALYRLRQYAHIYQDEGFGVAVIAHEQPGTLHVFKLSARPSVDFALLSDEEGTVRASYQLAQTGAFFVIDENKVVREKFLDVAHRGWPGHSHILTSMKHIQSNHR
jgi:peroxiredoxin